MAGTINYLYDPAQSVYVITPCAGGALSAVYDGVVIRVNSQVLETTSRLWYDIQLTSTNGTVEFEEDDVFPDLITAVAEYEDRLTP